MAKKVLIIYGSKYGATAEMAERIGVAIKERGLEVDVKAAKSAGSPAEYDAVVVGSAVYIGGWRKEVSNYIKKYEKMLAERRVWIFSSGPTNEGDPVELLKGWRYPKGMAPVLERVKPRDTAVFHGLVDPARMSGLDKWMINRVKSPYGDFRDWDAITKWAGDVAEAVMKE